MGTFIVNGTDLSDFGLILEDVQPWLSGLKLTRALTAMPGFTGSIPSDAATVESRLVTLSTYANTLSFAARTALQDALADLFSNGMNEITSPDQPSRVMRGFYLGTETDIAAPRLLSTDGRFRVSWLCPDPTKYDREPRGLTLGTTPVLVPAGTLPMGGVWRVMGPLSGAITMTYRALTGIPLGAFTVSGTLTSGEYLDVDLDRREITKYSSVGVASDAYAWKSSTAYWFRLDAGDSVRVGDQWASLEQSIAAGGGLFSYRRAWAN